VNLAGAARALATTVLCDTPAVRSLGARTRDRLTILLLHRVPDPALGNAGDNDLEQVVALLRWLRRWEFDITDLDDGLARLRGEGRPLKRTVCLTADDGYLDQVLLADTCAAHGMPITVFLATGFVDGELLPWWDQVSWIVEHAPAGVELTAGEKTFVPDRDPAATAQLVEWCKRVPSEVMEAALVEWAEVASVTVPDGPAGAYRPMSWDHARRLGATGHVSFGAHTVTHPILARVGAERADYEIRRSRQRIQDEIGTVSSAFCYPNGETPDFGEREIAICRAAGFSGAVTVAFEVAASGGDPYRVPRFPVTRDPGPVKRAVAGAGRRHQRDEPS
jgi:peptidoglycan/xylan/chitin deacetylase (PgdA/CDA1 family)